MVYTGTIVTEEEMALMAGEKVDATGNTETNHNLLAAQAESFLSVLLREDVVAGFSGYSSAKKNILSEWAARYAGIALILYNTVGYTSPIEAENMVTLHWARLLKIEEIIKDQKSVSFLKA